MGKQEYGRLMSSGTLAIGGTVAGLLGGQPLFNPVTGASFDTIHGAALIGTFTSTVPGDAGNGRVFLPVYSPTTVTLTATVQNGFTPPHPSSRFDIPVGRRVPLRGRTKVLVLTAIAGTR